MANSIGIDTSLVNKATVNSNSKKDNSSLDKDAFLQLLVAQMQYQDPLEPTDNTEYMSQLAQFSSVEELQNLNNSMAANQSLNMAGQYVILNVPDSAGNYSMVSGLVDYVTMKDGKAFFSINDEYYDAEYLDSVVSLDYLEFISRPENSTDKTQSADSATEESNEEKADTNETVE